MFLQIGSGSDILIEFYLLGGKWRCVHIDDPKSPEIKLPSLSMCLQLTPSEILKKLVDVLAQQTHPDLVGCSAIMCGAVFMFLLLELPKD